jgi:hypothetical protein
MNVAVSRSRPITCSVCLAFHHVFRRLPPTLFSTCPPKYAAAHQLYNFSTSISIGNRSNQADARKKPHLILRTTRKNAKRDNFQKRRVSILREPTACARLPNVKAEFQSASFDTRGARRVKLNQRLRKPQKLSKKFLLSLAITKNRTRR